MVVGFDRQFNRLYDYVSHQQTSTSFPPYNIRKEGEHNHVIEIGSHSGFSKEDIEVEKSPQGVLTIRSMKENTEDDTNVYRGISYRKFNRKFTLSDDIVVKDEKLENGIF